MNSSIPTDGQLLARFARTGDEQAFAEIVGRHGAMIYRICSRLCHQPQDAQDAAQNVFITLAEKARIMQSRDCLAGWLHQTAVHTCMRWRRGAMTRALHERQAARSRPDSAEKEAGLDAAEEFNQLCKALGALPEDYRNALILHHLEGYTIEQVAELLAMRPGTIAARLSRGRAMLRERLATVGLLLAAHSANLLLDESETLAMTPELARSIKQSAAAAAAASAESALPAAALGAAVPLTFAAKLKAACIVMALSTSTFAAGAWAAHCALAPMEPIATAGPKAQADPEPDSEPTDATLSSGRSTGVPEPSSLFIFGPLACLMRRPRRG